VHRLLQISVFIVLLIPLLVVLGITEFYFAAAQFLGHFPIPSIDDPKNLVLWQDYSYLSEWLIFSYFVLLFSPVVIWFLKSSWRFRRIAVGLIGFNWITYFCLHAVPKINVLEWFLD